MSSHFDALAPIASDSLLALIAMVNADPNPDKIDVGVGVYRDGGGATPIPPSVKEAERRLIAEQDTLAYLGMGGVTRYTELIRPILLGAHAGDERIVGLHTPGGCGALSLGFQLLAQIRAGATVHVGLPTWPNHPAVIAAAGLRQKSYPYYEAGQGVTRFDAMADALSQADRGDIVLLQGCCHNPTGADLDDGQWAEITRIVRQRGLIPFVDLAYQGLGQGLDEDAAGLRALLDVCDDVIVAQSSDKNFGVYRERVGNLFIKAARVDAARLALDHVKQIARTMWSMPPAHGAAAVAIVLDDAVLHAQWLGELAAMRGRINQIRATIAAADPRLASIGRQYGMFSMLPLALDAVKRLRADHSIYMADSGRFNIVGMADAQLPRFIDAVVGALDG